MILDGSLRSTVGILRAIPDPAARLRAFTGTIIAQGGTIILPPDDNTWGPHLVEFSLGGILGTGPTAEEALADWMTCATRLIMAERMVQTLDAPLADLRDACLTVRTRSADATVIAAAARLERAIAAGALQ